MALALRMTWPGYAGNYAVAEDDLVTVYWFTQDPNSRNYVNTALGSALSRQIVDPPATADEIAEWTAAATACVDEVAAAVAELRDVDLRTWRWRGRPLVRRWANAKFDQAKTAYLDRVRAAVSTYQPIHDVLEHRVAEQEAVRREAASRAYEEQERRRREAEAQFPAWEQRQEAISRRPESVRSEQARAEAVREVIEAITDTAAALEAAGRPGVRVVKEGSREQLSGWWVDFDWSELPDAAPLRTPPDMPIGHLFVGHWDYDLYLPHRELFTVSPSGSYRIAAAVGTRIFGGLSRRDYWWFRDIDTFADHLFPAWISYKEQSGSYRAVRTRITNHADPASYVPYVQAVARTAAAAFRALMPEP